MLFSNAIITRADEKVSSKLSFQVLPQRALKRREAPAIIVQHAIKRE